VSIYIVFPIIAAMCWGFAQVVGKKSVAILPVNTFNSVREVIAVLFGVVLVFVMRKGDFSFISWQNIDLILAASIVSIVGNVLNLIFLYKAMKTGSVSVVTIALSSSPIFVFIYSFFFFHEEITPSLIAGMSLTFFAIVLLSALKKGNSTEHKKEVVLPLIFAVMSGAFNTVIIIGNKILFKKMNYFDLNLIEGIVALIVFLLLSWKNIFLIFDRRYIKGTFYAALSSVVGRSFGCFFLLVGVNYIDSVIVAPISTSSMFFAIFFGAVLLKEKIGVIHIVSSVTAFIGVLLILMRKYFFNKENIMKVLVLGGTGNISREIVTVLLEKGHDVTIYNRGKRDAEIPDKVRCITGDRFDRAAFEARMLSESFDAVIDMICYDAEDAASTLRAFGSRSAQIIFTSSIACYKRPSKVMPPFKEDGIEYCEDDPLNPASAYGYKKSMMEKFIFAESSKYKGLAWSIVRPALTFGRWGANFGVFRQNYGLARRIRAGKPVVVFGDGQVPASFSFTPDVARGYAAIIGNRKAAGQVYHLNSMEYATWDIFYETLGRVLGTAAHIVHVPTDLLYKAAPAMNGHLFVEKQYVGIFDSSKAARELGFTPEFTLESGISWLVEWWDSGHAPEIKEEIEKFEDELVMLHRQWERQVEGKLK